MEKTESKLTLANQIPKQPVRPRAALARGQRLSLVTLAAVLVFARPVRAADIVWTNLAGGNWSVAANWNPNQVPGAGDTAYLTNSGTYAVTNNGTRTIGGLVVGGDSGTQTLAQVGSYTLTLNGAGSLGANGRLLLNLGTFTGTNVVTVDGQINWNAGTIGTSGGVSNTVIVLTTNAQLNLATTTTKTLNGSLTNAGRVTWSDAGDLNLNGLIHNLADGVFELRNDRTLNYTAAGAVFINDGRVVKSTGTGISDLETEFINNGTVEAQTGTVQFSLQPKTFKAGCQFIGSGTNLLSDGTATLTGTIYSENLRLGGATLAGNGAFSGTMAWASGSVGSGASLTVLPGATLQCLSATIKSLNGALTNAGLVTFSDTADINCYTVIHNLPGAVFDLRNDRTLNWPDSGTPVFINDGTLRKSAGTGVSDIEIQFINNGTVEAQTGTIQFSLSTMPKTFNEGCRFIGPGIVRLDANTPVVLNGTFYSENLVQAGAAFSGAGVLTGTLTWPSGSLPTNAVLTVATNGVIEFTTTTSVTIAGSLTNYGTLQWTGDKLILVQGVIHNQPGAVFNTTVNNYLDWNGGSPLFVNDGVFRKSGGATVTFVQIAMINNGTVEAQTGTIQLYQEAKTFNSGCRFIGAGQVMLATGTMTLAGTIDSENLVLAGATLNGAGSVNGSFTWTSGTLSSNVSFNVTPGSQLRLASASAKVINGSITNAGQVTWTGLGNLTVRGVIHNLPAGLFEIQNDEYLDYVSGSPVFINDGIVRKTVAGGSTICQIAFVNNGTLDVRSGTFQFVQQPKTFNAGCRFTGAGKSQLYAPGTITLAGAIESENLVLDGATVTGAGSVTGSFTWNTGTLTPDVSFYVTTNGLLLLASSGNKTLNGTITNAGTVRWVGSGNLVMRGAVHNLPGGLFDILNNEYLDFTSGTPVVVNEGIFRKSVGIATTTCQIPFVNRGRIEVNTGTLSFASTGTFTDQGGTIALAGTALQTAQPLTLTGQLTGTGTVKPGSGVTAALTSSALIAPATNGVLRIEGAFTQQLPGILTFVLGGTAPGTNHSRLNITGDAAFNGTLAVQRPDGYLPNVGDTFNVMSYKSRSGDFQCFNGLLFLGQDRRLLTQYTSTNLNLVTVAAADPTNVVPNLAAQPPAALVCWPAELVGWQLYAATNLNAPQWLPLPDATNRWFEPVMAPRKFFRLGQP